MSWTGGLTLARRQAQRLERFGGEAAPPPALRAVRELIVVGSSSRGGSSLFVELLQRSRRLLHLTGEITPFLKLAGLTYPHSGHASDVLGAENAQGAAALEAYLTPNVGRREPHFVETDVLERFFGQLHLRFMLQWPILDVSLDDIRNWALETLRELREQHAWKRYEFRDPALFHMLFLRRVRAKHPAVNPYYYDLPEWLIRRYCPDAPLPNGPPPHETIEEVPFILIHPTRAVTLEELGSRPVVVKTPSNAYRIPFLRALFPNAKLRILHLTRNAAAAVNGLYDGWHHHGFFSHRLASPLAICGYSELHPGWGDCWWNFDLPPGWQEWTGRPLLEVCAFQWCSAHRALLDEEQELPPEDVLQIRFEDITGTSEQRLAALAQTIHWLNVPLEPALVGAIELGLPPVMATAPPHPRRWLQRAAELQPVLRMQVVSETMERLGYHGESGDHG